MRNNISIIQHYYCKKDEQECVFANKEIKLIGANYTYVNIQYVFSSC